MVDGNCFITEFFFRCKKFFRNLLFFNFGEVIIFLIKINNFLKNNKKEKEVYVCFFVFYFWRYFVIV